jgi:hypothetical protein
MTDHREQHEVELIML